MGWKVVHLSKPCKIKVESENLLLNFYEDEELSKIKLTIKDLDFVIFDSAMFSITAKALSLLSKHNIATLFIDEEYHPSSILLPYHQHSTLTDIAHTQISISQEFKEEVWRDIIKSKISNQASVLKYLNNDSAKELYQMASQVGLYDKTGSEAQSARKYWKNIFENKKFRRDQKSEDLLNSMLNYIYAIIRACMARSVSASGFLPVFGIWHQNRYNSFNLVDDLIEPFRPICDIYIHYLRYHKFRDKTYFDVQFRRNIVALLELECVIIDNGKTTISKAIDSFVRNYKRAVMADDISLIHYPTLDIEFVDSLRK